MHFLSSLSANARQISAASTYFLTQQQQLLQTLKKTNKNIGSVNICRDNISTDINHSTLAMVLQHDLCYNG